MITTNTTTAITRTRALAPIAAPWHTAAPSNAAGTGQVMGARVAMAPAADLSAANTVSASTVSANTVREFGRKRSRPPRREPR